MRQLSHGARRFVLFLFNFVRCYLLDPTISLEDRDAEAATLRELQETMFDLEYRHRIYRRSLARETKYGSK